MAEEITKYPSLRGKTVLLTGGADGIGAAAVELFCRQGSKVVFFDIAEDLAAKLIEKIKSIPDATAPEFIKCDVTDLDQLKRCAEKTIQDHKSVDVLVNNAMANGPNTRVPTSQVTPESFDFDVNVGFRHQFFLTQAIVPTMQKQGFGSIINMGSISWRIPATDIPIYAPLKAAVMGMTRIHSKEFGKDGIRVNSIMPGSIATQKQIDHVLTKEYLEESLGAQSLKRVIKPVEVARLMLFLASDDASAITGSSYVVDGGWVSAA